MYTNEERASLTGLGLPTIFLRFGKALVYLVFIYYGLTITDNQFLIGIAFGVTALAQAILTIPFGFWSDKYGRKKMIAIGMVMFIIGSFLAAQPFDNIFVLIFARFLQGSGAIYSCVLGFISDIIPDSKRSRTMSLFSIFTGIVFSIGTILGPTIAPRLVPYSYLFLISGVLATMALVYFLLVVPEPKIKYTKRSKSSSSKIFKSAIMKKGLVVSYITTFVTNFATVSVLVIYVPKVLAYYMPREYAGLVLIPIFIFGMAVMYFTSKMADKGKRKTITVIALIIVAISVVLLFSDALELILIGLILFFTGMAVIDPILPSLIITIASRSAKGTSSGFYNVSRYLGEAMGGIIGGLLLAITIDYLLAFMLILIFLGMFLFSSLSFDPKRTEK
jgi:MFS family permease